MRLSRGKLPLYTAAIVALCSLPATAQQANQVVSIQTPGPSTPSGKAQAPHEIKSGTSNDRLLFALPNFLTLENAGQVPPLTAVEKFRATARGTFDPVEFLWYGALSGISQAN